MTTWTRADARIHRWTLFTAIMTFILLCSGGLVTSHGVGMSVPDWPNTFGYNMFAFPISHWIGGIFYEHSHRLIATMVGLFTAILACLLWARDTTDNQRSAGIIGIVIVLMLLGWREFWVYVALAAPVPFVVAFCFWKFIRSREYRWLGLAAYAAVILQGVLGGLRVVLYKDQIGIFHGMVAQSFFIGIVLLAVCTSRAFREKRWAQYEPHRNIRFWALGVALLIFLQLGVAATMRHEHIGLSIPDFPLAYGQILPDTSAEALAKINAERVTHEPIPLPPTTAVQIWIQMAHRFIACLIALGVAIIWAKSRQTTRGSQKWATLWLCMILVQIGLGAWTIWSNKAADIATMHMALGALSLMVGAIFTLRLFEGNRAQDFAWPDAPKRPMMGAV